MDFKRGRGVLHADRVLLDFITAIDSANDVNTLFEVLEKAALDLGYDTISYTYIPSLVGEAIPQFSPIFKISQSYDTGFIEHYTTENFAAHDFTIKRIKEGDLKPMVWWDEASKDRLSRKEKRVIEVARADYGMRHGISIPTYSNKSDMAGVSVTSNESDHHFSLLCTESLDTMRKISRIFSDRVLAMPHVNNIFLAPLLTNLSATERRILQGLCKGMSLKVVACEINITHKYAGNVVESLRSKLGNISRDRLLYIAGLMEFHNLQL
jgi:DNA-binding CsgD family transcriptional regulator